MQERLILSMGNSILTIDNDDLQKIHQLSDFCKSLGAKSSRRDPNHLTLASPSGNNIESIYSLAFELGLI